ncbi:MAG: AsmA-like C-terminal region-containing protein [Bacteroidales bacterium]
MRVVLSILAGLFFSVFVVIVVSFIISFIYEDEVSEIFLKELNNRVEEDIRAGDVNLSLLTKFPSAVVELRSFELYASSEETGKEEGSFSFSAEEVYFQFDVIDLFTGRYNLDHIYINQSQLNVVSGAERTRIRFRKKPSENVTLKLEKVVFNNLRYSILNTDQSFSLEGYVPKAILSGNVSADKFDLNVDGKMLVDNLTLDNFPYLQRKNLQFSLDLKVTPKKYMVKSGKIYYEELPLAAEGSFNREARVIDLSLSGNELDVKSTHLYLPWEIQKKMEVLPVTDGKLDFFARLNGPVKDGRPALQADFSLTQGEALLDYEEQPMRLKNISVTGYLSNGRYHAPSSSRLTLNNLHAEWNEGELNCDLELSDFKNPQLAIDGSATVNLENISEYFTHAALENSTGTLFLKYELNDDMEHLDDFDHLIRSGRLTGDVTFDHVTINHDRLNIDLESGFAYLDRDLYLDSLQVSLNGNRMLVNGKFHEIYENIADTLKPFRFDLALESPGINMNRFFVREPGTGDSQQVNFQFPRKLKGHVDFRLGSFRWDHFHASPMSGSMAFSQDRIEINQLKFNAFEGETYASAIFRNTGRDSIYHLDSRLYLNHVDIHKVFNTFNNFGQQYITHRNLKGYINGEVKLQSELNNHLKINKESLITVSDIEIKDGELVEFEPLIQTANFISLSELKHVTFSQLSNEITIEDRTVYIPEMDIQSSAVDITVSGYHDFDNNFSYRMNLLLSQVLSKRARNNDDFQSEFGNIQEDGVGRTKLFLKIHGTPEKYAIQYDKEGVKDKIREDLQREKNELKTILNEEFGWFNEDSVLQSEKSGKEDARFGISWEEDSGTEATKKEAVKDSSREAREGFIINWEDDTIE